MILDLPRFVTAERHYWDELKRLLDSMDEDSSRRLSIAEVERFHYLYERSSAGLAKLDEFSGPGTRLYLEAIVARAYALIQDTPERHGRWSFKKWIVETLPQTFRRRIAQFWLALAITMMGVLFGAGAVIGDPEAKAVVMPFQGLMERPSERVSREEHSAKDRLQGHKATFSASLMTHNIQVAIFSFALGLTWGIGTILLLFYNGVILGAVAADYIRDGQLVFLLGWLLPHGSIEIPAILVASQSGLVLANALVGWRQGNRRRDRLRAIGRDLLTLALGAALLLVWAGIVEAFLSQYHQPVVPYALKIAFGLVELAGLIAYLGWTGRK
ncbi:MAG: stage II sporulation protein M [Bryobacteraceae bacterium]